MKLWSDWIDIVNYRDFYDFPRMFLVVVGGRTFLFDCAFDDESDEYPAEYALYELSNVQVGALPHDWRELTRRDATCKGRIPIHSVVFDPTKRKQIKCAEFHELLS